MIEEFLSINYLKLGYHYTQYHVFNSITCDWVFCHPRNQINHFKSQQYASVYTPFEKVVHDEFNLFPASSSGVKTSSSFSKKEKRIFSIVIHYFIIMHSDNILAFLHLGDKTAEKLHISLLITPYTGCYSTIFHQLPSLSNGHRIPLT